MYDKQLTTLCGRLSDLPAILQLLYTTLSVQLCKTMTKGKEYKFVHPHLLILFDCAQLWPTFGA